jgi:hypothetical protein
MLLVIVGWMMISFAVFPVLALVHFAGGWQTALMALKLVMLPLGATCLLGATTIEMPHEARVDR